MMQPTSIYSKHPVNKSVTVAESPKDTLKEFLPSDKRYIPVEYVDGHKKPTVKGWKTLPQRPLEEISGPRGIVCGDGLFVLDVDHPEHLPEGFSDLPPTLQVETLHGGFHYYFRTVGEQPENQKPAWGDIQSQNKMVVAPGTTFDHADCGEDCPLVGEGQYQISIPNPLAQINPKDYPSIFDQDEDTTPVDVSIPDGEYDETSVATMEAHIVDFYSDSATTQRAKHYLQDLTWGKYSDRGFTTDSGDADRSQAELAFASQLYGICQKYGDTTPEENLHTVRNYITKSCDETRFTADGQPRKWSVRGGNYKSGILKTVFSKFDMGTWERFQQKKNQWDTHTNDYSDFTYKFVLEAVNQLAESGSYPTKNQVVEKSHEINPGERSDETYREALSSLQNKHGQIKMAYLGGNSYVYYPNKSPDPDSAEWIKRFGEKQ